MTDREQIKDEIKKQLNRYQDLRAEHRELLDELRQLEITMGAPSGSNWDGMPRSPGTGNPVERMAIKHLALEQRYKAQLEKLAAAQIVIEDMIEPLEPNERRLARLHYIDGLKWDSVCDKINYSWSQTHRIHSRMLDRLVAAELERRNAQK